MDYGGVFIVFSKIKALYELGIKIHLHCFEYGRGKQAELNKYCVEVIYYPREMPAGLPLRLPYIVTSRINQQLLKNLLKDNYPVLLEGIHCTYFLYYGKLMKKKTVVQLHNVEYEYYRQLAKTANNFYKKIYYNLESILLKKYEKLLAGKAKFVALSEKDKEAYEKVFSAKNVEFLPAFLPWSEIKSLAGMGIYCLYHGNLSVAENEKAAIWLLKNLFNQIEISLIIAGKNPSVALKIEVSKYSNVQLIENPSQGEMEELIKNAHIHLLPSFNSTGIKIKLLNALFNGRFVITNAASLEGTRLQRLCEIAETADQYVKKINELQSKDFDQVKINERKEILEKMYNNRQNAEQLMNWLS